MRLGMRETSAFARTVMIAKAPAYFEVAGPASSSPPSDAE
jgi:hypothetical protein